MTIPSRTAVVLVLLGFGRFVLAQSAPISPDRPRRAIQEQQIESNVRHFRKPKVSIEPDNTFSLAGLIDSAEAHNPETHVPWEGASAQLAGLVLRAASCIQPLPPLRCRRRAGQRLSLAGRDAGPKLMRPIGRFEIPTMVTGRDSTRPV
jgi:hypothetical protein